MDERTTDNAYTADGSLAGERHALRQELDRRASGQRLTPAQRRIAECLIENSAQVGFLSSTELAELAKVSQPSVTRFAMSLGFEGYLEMRKFLRSSMSGADAAPGGDENRYQTAVKAEIANLAELALTLADADHIRAIGKALAGTRVLPVVGLRASAGLARHFAYFAAKFHTDVRLFDQGGSILEDHLEQSKRAGADAALIFMMPLHPRETYRAIEFAEQIGLRVVLITDTSYDDRGKRDRLTLNMRINASLVFDSYAAGMLLVSVLLDAMCDGMKGDVHKLLERVDASSKKRKVFGK